MRFLLLLMIGLVLTLFSSCNYKNKNSDLQLSYYTHTFNAPISCISRSLDEDKLFIGLEDGSVIEKVNNSSRVFPIDNNHRIYDVLEYSTDSLFVGTRDAGLKLFNTVTHSTEAFYIKSKKLNYSVYSLALDSLNHILYVGTSNGFYKLHLSADKFSHELLPVLSEKVSLHFCVNKVAVSDRTLYVAGNLGLFISDLNQVNLVKPVIHSSVHHFSLSKDTVYALLEDSVIKITPRLQKEVIADGKYSFFRKGTEGDEWAVSNNAVVYRKDGRSLQASLMNGVSTNAKQVAYMGKDFFYLACKEQLLSFALHQNTLGSENDVIAVSDKRNSDTIFFLTDDSWMHRYRFRYNNPHLNSESLGQIRGLHPTDEVVKLVETDGQTFYLATKKELYKIKDNQAELVFSFCNSDDSHCALPNNVINTLFFSPTEHTLYVGTRSYVGKIDLSDEKPITPIPLFWDNGQQDTQDAYVVGICEKEDSLFVATLNKGLFGKQLNHSKSQFRKIRDFSAYGSTSELIVNGKNLCLNTSKGIVNYKDSTLLPYKHVKSIAGVYDKNPNEGYYILYYYGLSFKGLEDLSTPIPLFQDLSFNKSCIAVNGRKAVLGSSAGLFYYDGQSNLVPIQIRKETGSYLSFWLIGGAFVLLILIIFVYIRFFRSSQQQHSQNSMAEIEKDLSALDGLVKKLFDHLDEKESELENQLRKELKKECLNFVDKYEGLTKLSFMKRRGKERYNITVLLLIEDIDANIISRVLDVDQLTVNRHKYNARKEIEQMYDKNDKDNVVVNLLYDRIKTTRK